MTARFKYRIYPILKQKHRLAKLFGDVRVVWNDSLASCQEKYKLGGKKLDLSELQKLFVTQAKKTEDIELRAEIFNILLERSLNDLNQAYQNFLKLTIGNEIKPVKLPKFKSRHLKQTPRFTKAGFKVSQHKFPSNTKVRKVKNVCSIKIPVEPNSVTVIKD